MRKVIPVVNTTLDGYMAGQGGELDWMVHDPLVHAEAWMELRDTVDTMLVGRKAHQGFESHFREQATAPDSPADLVEFARWVLDTPKVVFSRTLSVADLSPSARLAAADIPEEVASLKQQPGKDLVLFGGASTVQSFVRQGLIDEYWIKLHPVAIGAGLPVFADRKGRAGLTLTHSKAHGSGILTLRYQPA
jgi:dihydrofolate reductase